MVHTDPLISETCHPLSKLGIPRHTHDVKELFYTARTVNPRYISDWETSQNYHWLRQEPAITSGTSASLTPRQFFPFNPFPNNKF